MKKKGRFMGYIGNHEPMEGDFGRVMTLNDLEPFFTVTVQTDMVRNIVPDTAIYLSTYSIPKMLSCMFQVPLPRRLNKIWFTREDAEKIRSQVNRDDIRTVAVGRIRLDTLLLLTNSPRFPYTMHVSRVMKGSDIYTCYDFILKLDIVAPEPRKEI